MADNKNITDNFIKNDIQSKLDELYLNSKNNKKFTNLMKIITSEDNILLAYENVTIKKDGKIKALYKNDKQQFITFIQNKFKNYSPKKAKIVNVLQRNGEYLKYSIVSQEDRIIQQAIKQVLDPICEAKFYYHSYGYRYGRTCQHAFGRLYQLINIYKLNYSIDIKIDDLIGKINHGKLLKQIWNFGIRDKQLISIISKILKTNSFNVGLEQTGLLRPLFINIALNELDWWISNQWENIKTKNIYSSNTNKNRALKNTKLKRFYIVRYGYEFKILCDNYKDSQKIMIAVKSWIFDRLKIKIDDAKVTNLRKHYTEFCGFKIKATKKSKKFVVKSHLNDKNTIKIKNEYKKVIKNLGKYQNIKSVNRYNAFILDIQNYCNIATHVNKDFAKIGNSLSNLLYNRTHDIRTEKGKINNTYKKYYGEYNYKIFFIKGIPLFPITAVKTFKPFLFNQKICNYTKEGRENNNLLLKNGNKRILLYLMNNPIRNSSDELNLNRISLYVKQNGFCSITNEYLKIGDFNIHHIIPKNKGGKDNIENLILITKDIHKLIHSTKKDTIKKLLNKLNLTNKQLEKINNYRLLSGNNII